MTVFADALLCDGRATTVSRETSNNNIVLGAFSSYHYGTVPLLLTYGNPNALYGTIFIKVYKLKDEFIVWRAFLLFNVPDKTFLEWRSCA